MRRATDRLTRLLAEIQNLGPFADDVEQVVLSCAVYGTRQPEIFRELDEDCFRNWSLFVSIKKQYRSNGIVSLEQLAADTNVESSRLKDYLRPQPETHLDYYIKILQQQKVQRAVVLECTFLIKEALSNSCNVDNLLDNCAGLYNKVIK